MVTGKNIHEPVVFCPSEFLTDGVITARNRVCNQTGDLVEWNEVDAKSPNKIFDETDIFLMRLGGEKGFETPTIIGSLLNLIISFERVDALLHYD